MRKQRLPVLYQFARFTGVGILSAFGHYGLLIGLVQALGVNAVSASAGGALLGAWINYWLNRRFTFPGQANLVATLPRFIMVVSSGVVLNTLLMWIGVNVLHVYYLYSQIVATILTLLWNFCLHKFWTFPFRHPAPGHGIDCDSGEKAPPDV